MVWFEQEQAACSLFLLVHEQSSRTSRNRSLYSVKSAVTAETGINGINGINVKYKTAEKTVWARSDF